MPATRPHVERDEKAAQILDAAEPLLLRDGYEATTMAAIARAAGVSPNAVYWYFPGKDELLAAVLRRWHGRAMARQDALGAAPLAERARAVLAELDAVASVAAAVHERARHSAAVAAAHEEFHSDLEHRAREAFEESGLDAAQAQLAAAAVIAMVEGVHLHRGERGPAARDELVLWAIDRFLAAGS